MKSWKHTLLPVLAVLTILSLLLSACGPIAILHGYADNAKDKNKDKVSENGNANETDDDQDGGANNITICHKTGSTKNPYVEITVSNSAVKNGHGKHEGDIIPAPKDGCPATSSTTKDQVQDDENETESETGDSTNTIMICHRTGSAKHPYVEIPVSNDAAKDGHAKHVGDIIPAPKDGCPTAITSKP